MKQLDEKELENIYGGESISAAVINAFTNIIKILQDAGHNLGSALRRIGENNMCPLK